MLQNIGDQHCCQWFKDKKFESNSQPATTGSQQKGYCCQWFKDKKFESNSQPKLLILVTINDCCQWFKDKKFESNSQRLDFFAFADETVISGSKIESLKAIHNQKAIGQGCKAIVIDLDKDMHRLNEKRLGTHIQWRHTDFEKGTVERCYVIYDGKAGIIDIFGW